MKSRIEEIVLSVEKCRLRIVKECKSSINEFLLVKNVDEESKIGSRIKE